MDFCQWKLVSNTKTTLHQNEAKANEAIKEAKAHCTAMISDTEATCVVTIREESTAYVGQACTLQQSLGESMKDLEHKAIEKEGQVCQSFLKACRSAIQACHPKAHRVHMYHLQLLTGNIFLSGPLGNDPNQPL